MNNPSLIGRVRLTLLAILVISIGCGNNADPPPARSSARSSKTYSVGVAQSNVSVKIDLTDKLNPAILPDVMREVLQELSPTEKPDSEKFQQQVVRKLSHKIISTPEVNYRVDLNEDSNLDPLLVVPESVQGQAAVYSVRVPDPTTYPKDPEAYDVDWDQVAKTGIELVGLSITFDQTSQQMVVNAETNSYAYEGKPAHYRSSYHARDHSWMDSYLRYMVIRDVLFGPYHWYRPGWYGGWYPRYYGGWHGPIATRTVTQTRTVTRYRSAPSTSAAPQRVARSSRAKSRTQAPKAIQQMKSKRTMAARQKTAPARSGGFGRTSTGRTTSNRSTSATRSDTTSSRGGGFGRSSSSSRRSSSFRGGSRGIGK